ncbi:MAG: DUF4381 domain-containing protein, partial [Geminicoccaceae bacterium]
VSLWPATAGWIWLGIFLTIGVTMFARRWLRHRRANAYRRTALKELDAAGDDPALIASILRRTALAAFPRAKTASLYGADWLAFLDAAYGGAGFRDGPGQAIAKAPYAKADDQTSVAALAAEWVRRHRREAVGDP